MRVGQSHLPLWARAPISCMIYGGEPDNWPSLSETLTAGRETAGLSHLELYGGFHQRRLITSCCRRPFGRAGLKLIKTEKKKLLQLRTISDKTKFEDKTSWAAGGRIHING